MMDDYLSYAGMNFPPRRIMPRKAIIYLQKEHPWYTKSIKEMAFA